MANAAECGVHQTMHKLSQDAIRITMEINSRYHTPDEINVLMSELVGEPVEVGLFPPFYTDCGKNIHLGKNVWVGSNSTILSGVTIGDNAVIGAGSVVTKDIPENMIAVGSPAKVVRSIYDMPKSADVL